MSNQFENLPTFACLIANNRRTKNIVVFTIICPTGKKWVGRFRFIFILIQIDFFGWVGGRWGLGGVYACVCLPIGCSGYIVCATTTDLCWSFWNLTGGFVMVWRYACGLDIILRLSFVTFFPHFELSHYTNKVWRQCLACVQFYDEIVLKLYRWFCHGLKMCMWFGYNSHHFFSI